MIRVGLCGYGGMGHLHANNLWRMPGVKLVAVCDIRPGQLAAPTVATNISDGRTTFDVRTAATYTDFHTMLRKAQLDVVVLTVPTHLHAPMAVAALRHGCHVFCEKPMGLSVAECDAMLRARDRARRELMIGQVLRFWPEYEALREAIQHRTYGRLLSLSMERISGYASWAPDNWFNDHRKSGGALLDLHLHDADWVLYACGLPTVVQAGGRIGRTGGIDDITALWDYADGPLVTMRGSWMHAAFTMNFRALFERAVLEYGFGSDGHLRQLRPGTQENRVLRMPSESGYVREMRYFLDCVRGRHANTMCPPESTRESVRIVLLEGRAARTRRRFILSKS